jgi:sulfide:quinone oxidoreductase
MPGLTDHGIDVWDPSNAGRAHDALAALGRGRLLVAVFGTPYPCPPGPFELALLAKDALVARGADVAVEVVVPMPIALPVVGPVQSGKVEALLENAGIALHRGVAATSVEPGVVHLADGRHLAFDLLLAVPPHRVPQLLVDAGLARPGGWVEVDPRTLATPFAGVYAVGDATAIPLAHGMPLPKAGLFAEAEGYVVAERIAAGLAGREPTVTFDGSGLCYAETGGGQAVEIQAHFYADPPGADIVGPSADAMTGKAAFESERLRSWFGS